MSNTDIYRDRERMPSSGKNTRRYDRKRRSSRSNRSFDQHERKRRSKNSGFRRLLHIYRKKQSEKVFWWFAAVLLIGILVAMSIWQFYYNPKLALEEQQTMELERQQLLKPSR